MIIGEGTGRPQERAEDEKGERLGKKRGGHGGSKEFRPGMPAFSVALLCPGNRFSVEYIEARVKSARLCPPQVWCPKSRR